MKIENMHHVTKKMKHPRKESHTFDKTGQKDSSTTHCCTAIQKSIHRKLL
jgi:hypothetical protein